MVPRELADALQAIGRQADATPFMMLLAAFQALLEKLEELADDPADEDRILTLPNAINSDRIFVDSIFGFGNGTTTLSRSLDHGDTFRPLLDLTPGCANRSRPACLGADHREVTPLFWSRSGSQDPLCGQRRRGL